ncbi:hypothetical protein FOWG_02393 [Fusarium oxysporum f. sp. lycopersici MN25]|nr:hypothetical protein FOWG_02393 [Fusarium oxysporum f. sp. lycopersici MN25]
MGLVSEHIRQHRMMNGKQSNFSISVVHGSDLELPKKGGLGLRSTVRALYRIESKGTACKAGNFQLTDRLFRHSVLGSESVVVWSVCGLSQCSL